MSELKRIRRALISVSDKEGIAEFAKTLARFGVEIISTGGTARFLREAGLTVRDVSEVTGFPEMMDGRVKTLHPKVHGAFLALRDNDEHLAAMKTHGIEPIDLVCVNLYPFEETIEDEDVKINEAVEQIDIGGPAMIRSSAKNWRDVLVVTDARLYQTVVDELNETGGSTSLGTRQTFAALAFTHTAHYDSIISDYLIEQLSDKDFDFIEEYHPLANDASSKIYEETERLFGGETDDDFSGEEENEDFRHNGRNLSEDEEKFSADVYLELGKVSDLRYGENPHQQAALYETFIGGGIANAEQLHGKEMSFIITLTRTQLGI